LHRRRLQIYNKQMQQATVDRDLLGLEVATDQLIDQHVDNHDHSRNRERETIELPRPQISPRLISLSQTLGGVSLRDVADTLFAVIMLYCIINLATARYVVEGASMEPNFHSDQFVVVNRLPYLLGSPARGDVIVFHNPENPSQDFIKRVIGLPGETIKIVDGRVYVNERLLEEPYIAERCHSQRCDGNWTVGPDQYFVLGDNRSHSRDGHNFGPLDRNLIIGMAWVRYWPPKDWGIITHQDFDSQSNESPLVP
jgi:signal peptidase I